MSDRGALPGLQGPGVVTWRGEVADGGEARPVLETHERFRGHVIGVRTDVVDFDGDRATRDVVEHPGAVGIIAIDDLMRVFLLRQYRHPVGQYLFEPPAGLLDVEGEPMARTAARELLEEAGLVARDWRVLVDLYNSPGGSDERLRIYLALGLERAAGGRTLTGEAEEAELPEIWLPLADVARLVLAGHVHNPTLVAGVLAAQVALAEGIEGAETLRPADAPWLPTR